MAGSMQFRLRRSMVTLFVLMALPFLGALVVLTYTTTSQSITRTAGEMLDRYNGEIIKNLQQALDPVIAATRSTAVLAARDPAFLRSDPSWEYLRATIEASADVFSAYVGFADGSFRAVYRASEKVRFFGKATPPPAVFAYRWLLRDASGQIQDRMHFIDAEGQVLEQRDVDAKYDPRARPWYAAAASERKSIVSGPIVYASNGQVGLTFATPVLESGQVRAVVAMDVALSSIQEFLSANRISENSVSVILDPQMKVVATSSIEDLAGNNNGQARVPQFNDLSSDLLRRGLLALPSSSFRGGFEFESAQGQPAMARLSDARITVDTGWRILIVAPRSDFLREISSNNRLSAAIGALAIVLEVLMIYLLARSIARPLEQLAQHVDGVEQLRFAHTEVLPQSSFTEIARLSESVDRMSKAIQAFAAFVPVDLVRGLMKSDHQIELGGRSRFLTIMFCDLESFSTLSEKSPSQELLLRVSRYLEIATQAINEEQGTVDKFIGDGVMAFWGAPNMLEDHALRACRAAVRIQQMMDGINRDWEAQGLMPLKVRIGIHSDAVLVGNIGSAARMSYTVMGDGVNVAARLEGVNKELGTRICVSKTVFREAGECLELRPLGEVTVKGRKSAVEIFELQGIRNSPPPQAQRP